MLGVGARGGRLLPLRESGVSPPEKFSEIFDAKSRVWGQFGPENKLIEGQPNEYDVIRRKASVLVFHLWPTICRSAKIFVGTASHRVPAPLHPCILYPITNRSLKTAEIGICTPLKLNICFMFVLETANVEVGTSHISEPTGKIW